MFRTLIVFTVVLFSNAATDFENARIVGLPRLTCSQRFMMFQFNTNIPFQGRISVMKKMYIPECSRDYSININSSATFKLDIGRCTDTTYAVNGTRILSAHIQIGFHPLVITNSDRVYSVQCVDNSFAIVRPPKTSNRFNCSHVVRLASKWEDLTVFHVGDSVVHEWSCSQQPKDVGRIQTFLTSCKAISLSGQVIHMIDENGCVVDPELLGDLVYNNYIPKIYARAKMFKLLDGERYRIECSLEMCRKDGECGNRPFPPKCAITKDELLQRSKKTKGNFTEDLVMSGSINLEFEARIRVSSEWITVNYNQYTNVDQLHERYSLSSNMIAEFKNVTEDIVPRHFLMDISYRHPENVTSSVESSSTQTSVIEDFTEENPFQHPLIHPTFSEETSASNKIGSEEENTVIEETTTMDSPTAPILFSDRIFADLDDGSNEQHKDKHEESSRTTLEDEIEEPEKNMITTTSSTTSTRITTKILSTSQSMETTSTPTTREISNLKTNKYLKERKTSHFNSVAKMKLYSSTPSVFPNEPIDLTTLTIKATTEVPFENNEIFNEDYSTTVEQLKEKPDGSKNDNKENEKVESFEKRRDWILDDRTVNETLFPDRQISCGNATFVKNTVPCNLSKINEFLLVWSVASLLLLLIILIVYIYKHTSSKSVRIQYRKRDLQRVTHSSVLQQEHPWAHVDAFEERKPRHKNEIDMSKF